MTRPRKPRVSRAAVDAALDARFERRGWREDFSKADVRWLEADMRRAIQAADAVRAKEAK